MTKADYAFGQAQRRLLPWAKVLSPREVALHEHLSARGFFVPVELGAGDTLPFTGPPFSGMPSALARSGLRRTRPPAPGENTEAILKSLDTARS